MKTTTAATTNTTGPRRGDKLPTGGRFVGKTAKSSLWVSYGDDADFHQMCESFDTLYVSPAHKPPRRTRRAAVA